MTQQIAVRTPKEITKNQAMYLLKTIWAKAPDVEIVKAAIICAQYGLNPLMKHIVILGPYTNEKTGEQSWAIAKSIGASRLIARRHHKYGYIDGPRVMTEAEELAIYGKKNPAILRAIVVIEEDGKHYPGYGAWLIKETVYGDNKGNTMENMAFIRAERNALDRMAPGELPDIGVADETYIEADISQALAEGKKEFTDKVEEEIEDFWGDHPPMKKPPEEIKPEKSFTFKSWGELAEAAYKLGVSPTDVFKRGGVKKWEDFITYQSAWNTVTELVMERKEKPKML